MTYNLCYLDLIEVIFFLTIYLAICVCVYTYIHVQTYIYVYIHVKFSSVQFSRSVVSDSLQPHESQHARPPCPPPPPGVHSDSRPSSRWVNTYAHMYACVLRMLMHLHSKQISF